MPDAPLFVELVEANANLQGVAVDLAVKRFAIAVTAWAHKIEDRLADVGPAGVRPTDVD